MTTIEATTKIKLTEFANNNLRALAGYLRTLAANGNVLDGVGFDLATFSDTDLADKSECQSSACAVGHFAIMLGGKPTDDGVILESGVFLDWLGFSIQSLGIKSTGASGEAVAWEYLFGDDWASIDNTPLGVVARIEFFLEHGVPNRFIDCSDNRFY